MLRACDVRSRIRLVTVTITATGTIIGRILRDTPTFHFFIFLLFFLFSLSNTPRSVNSPSRSLSPLLFGFSAA